MTVFKSNRKLPIFVYFALIGLQFSNAFTQPRPQPQFVTTRPQSLLTTALHETRLSNDSDERPYHEVSRQFRRTYFTHEDWIRHRSSDRLRKSLQTTVLSGVVRQLVIEIILVAALASFVCAWNAIYVTGYQDFDNVLHPPMSQTIPMIRLPLEPFTLSSPALGLLLVFRTNASYSRWLNGRQYWGSIVNHSRNIVRLGAGLLRDDEDDEHMERLGNAVWAFSRSLQRHLWGPEDDEAYEHEIRAALPKETADMLLTVRHKPTRAMYDLTCAVDAMPIPYMRRAEVDKSLVKLTEAMGGCERIFSSPVPLVYTRHTARFLGFWILFLPFGLWNSFQQSWNHIELVPAMVLISFFFFGVDELAIQLEEPFSILPLEDLVGGIRLSVDEHMAWNAMDATPKNDHDLLTPEEDPNFLIEELLG